MKKVVKLFSYVLAAIGIIASGAASVGCWIIFLDEPEAPESMIK